MGGAEFRVLSYYISYIGISLYYIMSAQSSFVSYQNQNHNHNLGVIRFGCFNFQWLVAWCIGFHWWFLCWQYLPWDAEWPKQKKMCTRWLRWGRIWLGKRIPSFMVSLREPSFLPIVTPMMRSMLKSLAFLAHW